MAPRTLPVRLYHWSQAAGFVLASQVLDFGDEWHQLTGYALAALIMARIAWGLAGSREDRLLGYLRGAAVWLDRHKRDETRPHPAGHAMALTLMLLVLLTAITGHMQTTDAFWGEEKVMTLHALASDLTTALVLLHVSVQLWRARHWQDSALRRMLWPRRRTLDSTGPD